MNIVDTTVILVNVILIAINIAVIITVLKNWRNKRK